MIMQRLLPNTWPKTAAGTACILIGSLSGLTFADNQNSEFPSSYTETYTHTPEDEAINYRHMSLYTLKQQGLNRNGYTPASNTPQVHHTHHHDHWGWGGGWSGYCHHGHCGSSHSGESFSERVANGLTEVASVAAIVAVAAAAGYGIAQAAFTLWPYDGAASLTAIELPANSPWRITGYRLASGYALKDKHFDGSDDAQQVTRENKMFDRETNDHGRFLLLDQENWWGLTDYPLNADVEFTRFDDEQASEKITVNFQRTVTNGLKPGRLKAKILAARDSNDTTVYRHLKLSRHYPGWTEFSRWYHEPTRAVIDFESF
ncbi:hypothetical protein [Parendozoicomonas haliclonae]|uniref:Uncharacterized protein n=1 Tax=Parendozoicomonas haliclonae TaxID=1960125 RepID=A0A1X7AF28_9GAMM|nr:hypothetical protein [Parendozoicomonas haliclonae]SMA34508.1 hypothetical protein EHSB41UT_00408 [Parendozoicomonas haliclonae]